MNGLSGFIAVGLAWFAQSPAPPPDGTPSHADTYCACFERGLEALDRGEHGAAVRGFLNAGELAYEAPVWRVHAGVALARAGDDAAATAFFRAALDAGYPPSDLAALDALGAATVAAWIDGLEPARARALDDERAGWRSVSARGLVGPEALRADVRHARFRPRGVAQLDGITHVIGTPLSPGTPRTIGNAAFEYFRVDPRASTATSVPRGEAELTKRAGNATTGGYAALVFTDAADPWPRGAPFVRAERFGLLIDTPSVRVERDLLHLRTVQASRDRRSVTVQTNYGVNGHRSIDLTRFALGRVPTAPPAPLATGDLEVITDPELGVRAESLLGRWVRLWRVPGDQAERPAVLLAARGHLTSAKFEPLVVLDEGAHTILHELDFSKARADEGLSKGQLYCGTPAIDPATRRLIVSLNVGDGTLEAFDLSDWTFAWRVSNELEWGGPREVSFVGAQHFTSSSPDFSRTELRRAVDGALLADAHARGFTRLFGSEDGSLLVGQGLDALYLYDGRGLPSDVDVLTREPRVALWLLRSRPAPSRAADVVAVASDGAWQAPAHALPRARVRIDDTFVPAEQLAPWLYDPLHVRTALDDTDPSPRRFPWPD